MQAQPYNRIFNFSAGPSVLPLEVLEQARDELINYRNSGMSVMEMSHRSSEYEAIIAHTEALVRELLGVSDDYAVLFLQGGASLQFSMIPMNLAIEGKPVDMLHTGVWTQKAIQELEKLSPYRLAASGKETRFTRIPNANEITLDPNASYVHMASNNTIYGTQWKTFPKTGNVPLVADMSSDIMSRRLQVNDFGVIFAGAQKNLGPAGVTLVIIKKDLTERCPSNVPTLLQYREQIKAGSMYNTPPTYGIYLLGLVMEWIKRQGGLVKIEEHNRTKADVLYTAIDKSDFYKCPLDLGSRSDMNIVFRIKDGDEELESLFVKEAKKNGLLELKGHRSAGGLRASLYNAQPLAASEALVSLMADFERVHG